MKKTMKKHFRGRAPSTLRHFFPPSRARCLCAASRFSPVVFSILSFAPAPMGAYASSPIAYCAAAAPPAPAAAAGDKAAAATSSAGSASGGSLLPAAAQAAIYGDGAKVSR